MSESDAGNTDHLWHVQSEPHIEVCARTEHLRILLHHSVFVLLGNLAATVTLIVGLWNSADRELLVAWTLLMVVFNVLRWVVGTRFPDGSIDEVVLNRWDRRFSFSAALSGVLWGAAGILFYASGQPEYGLFLALLVIGMCAAAAASLSYHRVAYPLFFIPAILPIAVQLMADEKLTANAVGFVLPFYFTLMYFLSRKIYQTAHESILARLNSQQLALLDYLTGVANRRAFEDTLEREWYRAMRDKIPVSLVIADIDNFKLLNDSYGHSTGDQILKKVAMILERRIRRGADLVARIGGEEFAFVLPDTNSENAVVLAESIRADLQKLAIGDRYTTSKITMSFGVTSMVPDSRLEVRKLFTLADAALYKAKRKGKDRVEVVTA